MTSVVIPDSVTEIGDEAFWRCTGLTSITIPSSVKKIGDEAFSYCTELTEVALQTGINRIAENAFRICPKLTCISVPAKKADYYKKRLLEMFHHYIVEREPEKKAKK